MGMSVGSAGHKGGRRRRGVPRYSAMADINMTPFIDVMLVLLIIFMVAAPLLASGVPIDLPQTKASPLNVDQKPLSVAVDDKGDIFVLDQPVAMEELPAKLQALAKDGYDERIYVRGAKTVNYGRIAQVMSVITTAGYKKVALVTDQDQDSK
jgi:biopolymer transport protein TolR